jgi:transcription-repair coupling factor (superfamily II helicase)
VTNPGLREQLLQLTAHGAGADAIRRIVAGDAGRLRLAGLTTTAKALYLSACWEQVRRPLLVLTETPQSAEALVQLVETFHGLLQAGREAPAPLLLPALDTLPGQNLSPHPQLKAARAVALHRLATGRVSIVVAPVMAALARTRLSDEQLFMMRRELEAQLRPYRSKMSTEQLARLEKSFLDRKVYELCGLPRLSLFFMV